MKAARIVYGVDPNTDAGWQILLASPNISEKAKAFFVELCSHLPLPRSALPDQRVYFCAARRREIFLGCAVYKGQDRVGRPGAWRCEGFMLPKPSGPFLPYATTEVLLRAASGSAAEEVEVDDDQVPDVEALPKDYCEAALQHKPLVLTGPDDNVSYIGTIVDRMQKSCSHRPLWYAFPTDQESPHFDVIGMRLSKLIENKSVVVKLTKRKHRRRLARAMVLCVVFVLGSLLGLTGASVWAKRNEQVVAQRARERYEALLRDLRQAAGRLEATQAEDGTTLKEILQKITESPEKLNGIQLLISGKNFLPSKRESLKMARALSQIIELLSSVR